MTGTGHLPMQHSSREAEKVERGIFVRALLRVCMLSFIRESLNGFQGNYMKMLS